MSVCSGQSLEHPPWNSHHHFRSVEHSDILRKDSEEDSGDHEYHTVKECLFGTVLLLSVTGHEETDKLTTSRSIG